VQSLKSCSDDGVLQGADFIASYTWSSERSCNHVDPRRVWHPTLYPTRGATPALPPSRATTRATCNLDCGEPSIVRASLPTGRDELIDWKVGCNSRLRKGPPANLMARSYYARQTRRTTSGRRTPPTLSIFCKPVVPTLVHWQSQVCRPSHSQNRLWRPRQPRHQQWLRTCSSFCHY
jgi:hypothetical protein